MIPINANNLLVTYCTTSLLSTHNEPHPVLWSTVWAGKIVLSCPLRIMGCPTTKNCFLPHLIHVNPLLTSNISIHKHANWPWLTSLISSHIELVLDQPINLLTEIDWSICFQINDFHQRSAIFQVLFEELRTSKTGGFENSGFLCIKQVLKSTRKDGKIARPVA